MPPIFDNNIYVTNFQQKAKNVNVYFAEQCKLHDNGSVLPDFISRADQSLSLFHVNTDKIVDIIQKYSTKQAHGCDEISVAMLQLCVTEVALPLSLIFQKCVSTVTFPDLWKSVQTSNQFTKNPRQVKSNYRPISLLPICISFLNENKLICKNQSGFRPDTRYIISFL